MPKESSDNIFHQHFAISQAFKFSPAIKPLFLRMCTETFGQLPGFIARVGTQNQFFAHFNLCLNGGFVFIVVFDQQVPHFLHIQPPANEKASFVLHTSVEALLIDGNVCVSSEVINNMSLANTFKFSLASSSTFISSMSPNLSMVISNSSLHSLKY